MKTSKVIKNSIILGLLVVVIILFLGAKSSKDSTIDRMITGIPLLSIFFLGLGVLLSIEVWDRNIDNNSRDNQLKLTDRVFTGLNKTLIDTYPKCPNLINSLFLPWQQKPMGELKSDPNKSDLWISKNFVALRIFQAWEDFLAVYIVEEKGALEKICLFIPYANSRILKEIWQDYKAQYDPPTLMFADLLFNNVTANPPNNSKELEELGQKIIKSKEFRDTIDERIKMS